MRLRTVAILFLMGCGSEADPDSKLEAQEQTQGCTVSASARFFWDATQVQYDYQPRRAQALVEGSELVIRGRLRAIEPTSETTRLTIEVEHIYKGDAALGSELDVELGRSEAISASDFQRLAKNLPRDAVTLFLTPREGALSLTTPQALLVSGPCGVAQALDDAPIFAEPPSSDVALDAALREITGR
ncbi:MAG: hypothetical protein ABW352_24015 [Polyangiales bacterium]